MRWATRDTAAHPRRRARAIERNRPGYHRVSRSTRRRWNLSQNTPGGEGGTPTEPPDEPVPEATPRPPQPGASESPWPAGILQQARRTIDAVRRLVTAHVALARTEISEIVERAKAAAIFVGIAIALLLFAAILASVGTTLFLGGWLFGSIGWGVLHGTLLCLALIVVLLLAALEIPPRRLGATLAAALGIGVVVAVVLGLAWPHELFARTGNALLPGVETGVRPLVAGVALGALLGAVIAFLAGARAAGASGALAGLIGGAVLGAVLGAFLAISFRLHVGIALGITATLIAWPALAAAELRSFDWGALKARYWPAATIETTKETIEWVRARTPLGRRP